MTAAMRTDPRALDALAEQNAAHLDPSNSSLLRTARMLTLATSAALTTVLTAHRYGRGNGDRLVWLACRIDGCRTVRGISEVLSAHALRAHPVDLPEAWRRADAWYARAAGRPVALSIESFEGGFIARPATPPARGPRPRPRHRPQHRCPDPVARLRLRHSRVPVPHIRARRTMNVRPPA